MQCHRSIKLKLFTDPQLRTRLAPEQKRGWVCSWGTDGHTTELGAIWEEAIQKPCPLCLASLCSSTSLMGQLFSYFHLNGDAQLHTCVDRVALPLQRWHKDIRIAPELQGFLHLWGKSLYVLLKTYKLNTQCEFVIIKHFSLGENRSSLPRFPQATSIHCCIYYTQYYKTSPLWLGNLFLFFNKSRYLRIWLAAQAVVA